MSKTSKSRKAKVYYTLLNSAGDQVSIDLNNYKCVCVVTGKRKSFYHKYLYDMIMRKYAGNIDTFRTTYQSREAAPDKHERQVARLQQSIDRHMSRINELKNKIAHLESATI